MMIHGAFISKGRCISLGRVLEYSQRENSISYICRPFINHYILFYVWMGYLGWRLKGPDLENHDDLYSQVGSPSESIIQPAPL